MGDDAELWIESGGDPTTLIDDWYWDEYELGVCPIHKVKVKSLLTSPSKELPGLRSIR